MDEGRTRLNLIAQEVARLAGAILAEYQAAARKLKDARPPKEVADDVAAQLQRLMPKRFLATAPYAQLQHYPRYLKARHRCGWTSAAQRPGSRRAAPGRTAAAGAAVSAPPRGAPRASTTRGWRFRWLLEELRVSLFAQELRTPRLVSVKRLEKVWAQIST